MSDCGCYPRTLGLSPEIPRELTPLEQSTFLARHPLVATWVSETQVLLTTGTYDWFTVNYPPGVIPSWGMQVDDSTFGKVTIFPAADGRIRFSGWQTITGDINNPPPIPEPFEGGVLDDLAATLGNSVNVILVLGGLYLLTTLKQRK
jgi:hypothetical protein